MFKHKQSQNKTNERNLRCTGVRQRIVIRMLIWYAVSDNVITSLQMRRLRTQLHLTSSLKSRFLKKLSNDWELKTRLSYKQYMKNDTMPNTDRLKMRGFIQGKMVWHRVFGWAYKTDKWVKGKESKDFSSYCNSFSPKLMLISLKKWN